MKFFTGLLIGLQFFTAVPITKTFSMDEAHLKRTVQAFPLLGLLQGIVYSGIFFIIISYTPFSHLAAAFLLWLLTICLTGGIHLDGWMDASDAYFSYQDQEKRLIIMKDPRIGAFGVLSVIILLSTRFLFIYEITGYVHPLLFILIASIPFLGKTVMGILLLTVQAAKKEGLGHLFQSAATVKVLWVYPIYLLLLYVAVVLVNVKFLLAVVLVLVSACCLVFSRRKAVECFGGITGDVLGASVEGTELVLWMTVWLLHYFVIV
ncbi:adenosylcobinamide-GDP ribazoletransferase [Neobacillus sp. Marseille-QA0830]